MTTASLAEHLPFLDLEPAADSFSDEAIRGLTATPKTLPSKFFYDARGSELFDAICRLEEYYLTRTELAIMKDHVDEMAQCLGSGVLLVEYGSGSSLKTRILLDRMQNPAGYVPIDISREHLLTSAAELQEEFPTVEVLPVCADYTDEIKLPKPRREVERVAVYFPGSTIGNFHPDEAEAFLRRVGDVCGSGGALLIGVDLDKSPSKLHAAYNDSDGVTSDFNKNLLRRMNRELGANFRLDRFAHEAVYNEEAGRIEMYLVSRDVQQVEVAGKVVSFAVGERICTEYSYKYSLERFRSLAGRSGFDVKTVWTDAEDYFSVHHLIAR